MSAASLLSKLRQQVETGELGQAPTEQPRVAHADLEVIERSWGTDAEMQAHRLIVRELAERAGYPAYGHGVCGPACWFYEITGAGKSRLEHLEAWLRAYGEVEGWY